MASLNTTNSRWGASIAHQIYGDPEMHDQIRQLCMDYMELNRDHFSQYVTEEWSDYIRRKRQDRCFGNHAEMQAMSELFNRPIEVYAHCTGSFKCTDSRISLSRCSRY